MPRRRKTEADDNPEWTKRDFARAKPLEDVLPPGALASFRKYRGPQQAPKKVPVSIRLSPAVVAHFKSTGPGWQRRIDEALLQIAKRRPSRKKGKAA